jgi:hypothetical protein
MCTNMVDDTNINHQQQVLYQQQGRQQSSAGWALTQ